jgi:photosystem II stability/assembly factor-like uncharacterized protein
VTVHEFEGLQVYGLLGDDRDLWAVVPARGLFRSEDRGERWERVVADLDGRFVRALARHPRNPEILFAGTEPAALFVTRDRGASWEELSDLRVLGVKERWRSYGDRQAHVETVACDPHDPQRLYVGIEIGGVYRSDDGGASWVSINEGIFDDVHHLAVDPREGARIYAATGGGLFVSSARGLHWERHPEGPGSLYCTRLAVLGPGDPLHEGGSTRLFVATTAGPPSTWRSGAEPRLWSSTDAGVSWASLALPGLRDRSGFTALGRSPAGQDAGWIGTGSGNLYHGRVRGGGWTRVLFGLRPVRAIRAF